MAHKQVLFRSAAREKILRGTTQLADAIRVTLGPKSKSVLIERKWGAPIVCNDGVTIAKDFDLKAATTLRTAAGCELMVAGAYGACRMGSLHGSRQQPIRRATSKICLTLLRWELMTGIGRDSAVGATALHLRQARHARCDLSRGGASRSHLVQRRSLFGSLTSAAERSRGRAISSRPYGCGSIRLSRRQPSFAPTSQCGDRRRARAGLTACREDGPTSPFIV